MRVCVLYDDETYGFTPAEFLKKYDWEMVTLHRPVFDKIAALNRENRFDVYFNLCDGASDEEYPGVDVIEGMEQLNMPFTGANSRCYDPSREQMQAVAEAGGIGFARGHHITSAEGVEEAVGRAAAALVDILAHAADGHFRQVAPEVLQTLRNSKECAEYRGVGQQHIPGTVAARRHPEKHIKLSVTRFREWVGIG